MFGGAEEGRTPGLRIANAVQTVPLIAARFPLIELNSTRKPSERVIAFDTFVHVPSVCPTIASTSRQSQNALAAPASPANPQHGPSKGWCKRESRHGLGRGASQPRICKKAELKPHMLKSEGCQNETYPGIIAAKSLPHR